MCWNVLNITTYTYLWRVGNLYKHTSTLVSWFATNEQQINVVIQSPVYLLNIGHGLRELLPCSRRICFSSSRLCAGCPIVGRLSWPSINQSINQSIIKRSTLFSLETGLHSTNNTYPMSVNLPYGPCRKIAIELKINSLLTDIHVMKTNSNQACVH